MERCVRLVAEVRKEARVCERGREEDSRYCSVNWFGSCIVNVRSRVWRDERDAVGVILRDEALTQSRPRIVRVRSDGDC
jgi:hypothetical protein